MVNSVRRRFGFSEQEKLEEIFRAIELGAATIADVARETLFPVEAIHGATKILEQHRLIEFQRISLTGQGRPSLMIRIINDEEKTNHRKFTARLLSAREVCDVLRISRSTLGRLCAKKKIEFYKSGRTLRFESKALEEFLEKKKVKKLQVEEFFTPKK
ncbi:MAG TPA: helix-turn-helix domain-containing protein [Pyrinomonadaceae bacterium]|nr:helix-turn-helix domain-containing protein [Pyrinomonadaceae bacterium]